MVANTCTTFDPNWYLGSQATNNITPDPNNLLNKTNYLDSEQTHVGDGTGLLIKHARSSSFYFPFNSGTLSLKQLLHVPSINKNLISVSKF